MIALLKRIICALARNSGRDLANIGHAKRKADVKAVARKMRCEMGLPEHPGLAA